MFFIGLSHFTSFFFPYKDLQSFLHITEKKSMFRISVLLSNNRILIYEMLSHSYTCKGPSIKYVTLFLANFDPPLCHTLSHVPGPPKSTSHISNPPLIFRRPSTKIPDKNPLYKFYLNCSQRFLSGGFCLGWFLSVPPSVTIHLLQQKVKDHFKFHV